MASSFLRIYLEGNTDRRIGDDEHNKYPSRSTNGRSKSAMIARNFQAVEYDQFKWDMNNFGVVSYKPCRSCIPNNPTGYVCAVPLETGYATSELNPIGHLFCTFCQKYMPSRGNFGMPALDQACSFCGVVACDSYWGCFNHSHEAKLYLLRDIGDVDDFDEIFLTETASLSSPEEGYLNLIEIKYLKEYLSSNNISWKEVWKTCTEMFDNQEYICSAASSLTLPAQDVCHKLEDAGREHFTSINAIAPRGNTLKRPHKTPKETTNGTTSTHPPQKTPIIAAKKPDGKSRADPGYQQSTYPATTYFSDKNHPSECLMACYSCASDITNGQLYGYWKGIPIEKLPEHVGLREVCEWGEECTAQWSEDDEHAKKFSHVDHN
ncbi:hypothetical protein CLU79DRAFT_832589 [Phycomyces nitens]|nr:hypothetical protein CLU79DRAFT_832589 [Phycomyces nitens]